LVGVVSIAAAAGARAYLNRFNKFRSRVVGIIPARFASSRFQGKPLVHILGKPMIQVCSVISIFCFCFCDILYTESGFWIQPMSHD